MSALRPPASLSRAVAAGLLVGAALVASASVYSLESARERGEAVGADAPAYVRIARGLLAGSIELPPPGRIARDTQQRLRDPFGTPYALGRDGRLLPKHSLVYAALVAPGVALGGDAGAVLAATLLAAGVAAFVTARAALTFGALPALAASLALFLLSPGGRWVATGVNVDTALAGAMALAFFLASSGHAGASGALAGLSAMLRPTAVLLLAPSFFAARGPGRRRERLRFVLGLALGAAATGLCNALLWGAPWRTSYDRALVVVDGTLRIALHSATFGADPVRGFAALFLDPGAGFARLAPAALLALTGYLLPRARTPEWLLASASALASLLLLSSYSFVQEVPAGNFRFGFPLLVSAVPPLAALFSAALERGGPSGARAADGTQGAAAKRSPSTEKAAQPQA